MLGRSFRIAIAIVIALGAAVAGCGKRRAEPVDRSVDVHDSGSACIRVVSGAFQSPGKREIEATVTARGWKRCTDFDLAACTVDQGEHGEIVVMSTVTLLAPAYGKCATGRDPPLAATCHAIVDEGTHDIVFGPKREKHSIDLHAPLICIEQ